VTASRDKRRSSRGAWREAWARFDEFVRHFEELPWGALAVAGTVTAIVTVRNLLEIAAGTNPIFTGLQAFVHYPLAYVGPFVALTLVLAGWGRVAPGRVARLMSLAWLLTLLPPIVDVILHRQKEGVTIGYLQVDPSELPFVLVHFFDPRVSLTGTTPGIRVEALLAVLLGGLYIWMRSGRWWRALAGAITVYLTSLFFFTLPTLVHALFRAMRPGLTREELFRAAGAFAHGPVDALPDRLAVFWLVPVITLLGLLWWGFERRTPADERWLVLSAREEQTHAVGWILFSVLLAVTGCLAGLALTIPADGGPVVIAPYDLLALLALGLFYALLGVALDRRDGLGGGAALLAGSVMTGLGAPVAVGAVAAVGPRLPFLLGIVPRWARVPAAAVAWGLMGYAAFVSGYALVAGSEALARLPAGVAAPAAMAGIAVGIYVGTPWLRGRWWSAAGLLGAGLAVAGWLEGSLVLAGTGLAVGAVAAGAAGLVGTRLPDRERTAVVCAIAALAALVLFHVGLATPQRDAWRERAQNVVRLIRLEAVELMQQGEWAEAKPIFEEALEVDPEDVESLRGMGLILLRQEKRPQQAAEYFRRAVEADPDSARDWSNLGAAHLEAREFAEARDALERAVELAPRDPRPLFNLATCLERLERTRQAASVWRRFVEAAEGQPQYRGQIGYAQRRLRALR
jgi:tetratricopeptide (TPR) repeat protein